MFFVFVFVVSPKAHTSHRWCSKRQRRPEYGTCRTLENNSTRTSTYKLSPKVNVLNLTVGVANGSGVLGMVLAVRPRVLQPALVQAVVQLALRARAPQVGRPHGAGRPGDPAGHLDDVAIREALALAHDPSVPAVPVAAAHGAPHAVDTHLHPPGVGGVVVAHQAVRNAWIGAGKATVNFFKPKM